MSFLINPYMYATAPSGCTSPLISTTNLQAYYKFDNNTDDSSGNAYNGTGNDITYGTGKFLSAATFNGTSSYVAMPAEDYSISTSYTLSAWIKTTGTTSQHIITSDKIGTGARRSYQFRLDDSTGVLRVVRFSNNTTVVSNFVSTAAVNTGSWVHVAMVFDNAVGTKIYINGSVDGSDAVLTNQHNVTDYGPDIGAVNGQPYEGFFNGDIDEAIIFNRALSEAEIGDLAAGTCPLITPPSDLLNNLIAAYHFESDFTDSYASYDLTSNGASDVTFGVGKDGLSAAFITGSTNTGLLMKRLYTSSQVISTPSSNTSGYTVSSWVNFDEIPGVNASFVWLAQSSGNRLVYMSYDSGGFWTVGSYNGSTSTSFTYVNTPAVDTWIHTLFVMQPTTGEFKFYLNNVEVISNTFTLNGNAGGSFLSVGNHQSVAQVMTGYLDEFTIWGKPLTADERAELYNSGAGKFYPF